MRKRNHKRRPVDPLAGLALLGRVRAAQSREPLTQTQQDELSRRVHFGMKSLIDGKAEDADIADLVDCANVSLMLAEYGLGETATAVAGQDAMARIGARAARLGRYVATGEDIKALNAVIEQYDAQVASPDCPEGVFLAALRAVKQRCREGNVVQVVECAPA